MKLAGTIQLLLLRDQRSNSILKLHVSHRTRINTEAKAKVVSAVWGAEFIEFLAALANVH